MEDNDIVVNIQQDIHYTHNNINEPVFNMSVIKPSRSSHYYMGYTVPDMIAIRNEINRFLLAEYDEYYAERK